MIKVELNNEGAHALVEGELPLLMVELQVAIATIMSGVKKDEHLDMDIDEVKNFILESCAFALCEEDERTEILEHKEKELKERRGK